MVLELFADIQGRANYFPERFLPQALGCGIDRHDYAGGFAVPPGFLHLLVFRGIELEFAPPAADVAVNQPALVFFDRAGQKRTAEERAAYLPAAVGQHRLEAQSAPAAAGDLARRGNFAQHRPFPVAGAQGADRHYIGGVDIPPWEQVKQVVDPFHPDPGQLLGPSGPDSGQKLDPHLVLDLFTFDGHRLPR